MPNEAMVFIVCHKWLGNRGDYCFIIDLALEVIIVFQACKAGVFSHAVCGSQYETKMGGSCFYPGACSRVKIDASQLLDCRSNTYCVSVFVVFFINTPKDARVFVVFSTKTRRRTSDH